jgi:hypothetical protein
MVSAQPPAPGSGDDHQLIQQLLDRVKDLESEVKRLRGVPATPATEPSPVSASTSAAATPAPQVTGQALANAAADQMGGPMHDTGIPGMQIRGFSDIDYRASDQNKLLLPNTFSLGQFNLFITSKLSEQFSVLAEVVIEADETNAVGVDLERLLLRYTPNDFFNLSIGRYHTGIGFYSTAFHHSEWMQTTATRPLLFEFEDGGGILPIHNVGLSATGRIPSGALGLHYIAELGNGRTSRSPLLVTVQNKQDENNGKSVNFGLLSRPKALPGFETGISIYHDRLYPDTGLNIVQNIYSAHATYEGPRFEFLNEAVVLTHKVESTGRLFTIPTYYSQISKAFGKVRPYARYEYINVPRDAPLFGDVGLHHGPIAGIRYDFSEFAAYKLEYFRLMQRDLPAINGFRTQVAFTF